MHTCKCDSWQNQLRSSKILQWHTVSQTRRSFVKPRRHLAGFVLYRTLLVSLQDSSWLHHHHLDTLASLSWNRERCRMKCRNQQADAHSVLAPGQPCWTQDDSSRITFQFPRKFFSSSTGLWECLKPVRADQPSQNPKHWGSTCQKPAEQDQSQHWNNPEQVFLFWTITSIFTINWFCNCMKNL